MEEKGDDEFLVKMIILVLYGCVSLLISPVALAAATTTSGRGFRCVANNATCQALLGYMPIGKTLTLAEIQAQFQVENSSSIVGRSLLPPASRPPNYASTHNVTQNQSPVIIPIPCRCINGTGLSDRLPIYTVSDSDGGEDLNDIASLFGGFVDQNQIAAVNGIGNLTTTVGKGRKMWIPLPCSCDDVDGQRVVHYAHLNYNGDALDAIAAQFGTSTQTLMSLNNVIVPNDVYGGQILDVPLKPQTLDHLVDLPSQADGVVMKRLAYSLTPKPADWSGSNFCLWSNIACDINGFVTTIRLSNQYLSGTLPSNLNSLSHLTYIDLGNNYLSGAIPSFANLTFLNSIDLSQNLFTSVTDGAFTGISVLNYLSIHSNPTLRPWAFPVELARDSTKLEQFWASNASLSGNLDVLARMTHLNTVYLSGNKFTGSIPDLSNCTHLEELNLANNLLTGLVPTSSLLNLSNLYFISLQNNKLQGPLPVLPKRVQVTLGHTNLFCRKFPGDCDPEVTALLEVAGALGFPLNLAEAWPGNDACKHWPFVTCVASQNVVVLDLSKQGFGGTISPAIANLTYLQELHLNGNNLTGVVPEILTTLPMLRVIDVSDNDLTGPVPSFQSSVSVFIGGNKHIGGYAPNFTTSATPSRRPFQKTAKLLPIVTAPTILGIVLCILAIAYRRRNHQEEEQVPVAPDSPFKFPYEVLKRATNNFDEQNRLGGGGFGSVFEGILGDGTRIAVKRLDHPGQGRKEFQAEVRTIGSIHHINLVKLVGFCAEKMHTLLVYEHMSNGSLDKWIFNADSRTALDWDTKKKITLHIARGLAYLHEECQKRIVHLDVKPQNVLLDDKFNAKLSDFGLAKLMDREQSFAMTQMRGTRGYLAPEWLGRQISEKADVYSYGVVVLEVVFGKKNLDCTRPEESTLIQTVRKKAEASELSDVLVNCSKDMQQNGEDIEKTVKLAIWCLNTEPARRPSMSTVVKVLEGKMMLEAIHDYSLTTLMAIGNPTIETTQVLDSVLSGPR